jgi:pimeloyl-ACP methyl ester carboxylesterase
MKQIFIVILFLQLIINASAQDNWVAYSKWIPAKDYQGKKFRVKAFIRVNGVEESASARLWARVDKVNNEIGFFNNNTDNPATSKDWHLYTMEGIIDKDAGELYFGVLVQYNGDFFLDDLEVEVETKNKKWSTVYKSGFEEAGIDLKQGTWDKGTKGRNNLYTSAIDNHVFKNGKQSLKISGAGVPNFGVNSTIGKYSEVNGIKLYYEIYGSGPPLVVLHGNGGAIDNAGSHYPKLMEKYKIIAIDSRGQGKSTDTDAPLTYDQMAADVNALLEELKTDSVFIWGQSDGAILGLILAMDYPKKVKRVLSYGANVQPDSSALFPWFINWMDKTLAGSKNVKEKKLMQLMKDYPHISYEKLATIKAPVLVMAGDRDVIRPEHTLKIFQHIPNAHMAILPGATHGGSWDKQELFLQMLDDFFLKPFSKPDTRSWFE